MELRHLRYFVAVAEELHFGRAAQRLHMAQPPLSQRIRVLEKEVGVQLLIRNRREVRLTDAGKTLLADARELIARADHALEAVKRTESGVFGTLRVGAVEDVVYELLPAIIRTLRERAPYVQVDFRQERTGQQLQSIRAAEIDVGILHGPLEEPDLDVALVLRESVIVGLPASHPQACESSVLLSNLADDAFIVPPLARGLGRAHRFHDRFIYACKEAGFSPTIGRASNDTSLRINLAAAGLGVAVLPAWAQLVNVPGVVFRPLRLDGVHPLEFELVAAWRKGNDSRLLSTFLEAVHDAPALSEAVPLRSF